MGGAGDRVCRKQTGNSNLTDAVNLRLEYDRERFPANPHQVGHVLTSFGLTERKRTNAGWVLLLSRDTRARIHTLLRRYALEIDTSVNRDGCSLCSDLKNPPSGANESTAEPQKTVPPGGLKFGEREHGELKTG